MTGLQLTNVSKFYKEGDTQVTALNNVSITVEQGEFIAVIGPSGSGKSTFLSIAGALLQASEGVVKLDGKELAGFSGKELAKVRLHDIGFILQTSNLIPYLTILDQLLVVKKMSEIHYCS